MFQSIVFIEFFYSFYLFLFAEVSSFNEAESLFKAKTSAVPRLSKLRFRHGRSINIFVVVVVVIK